MFNKTLTHGMRFLLVWLRYSLIISCKQIDTSQSPTTGDAVQTSSLWHSDWNNIIPFHIVFLVAPFQFVLWYNFVSCLASLPCGRMGKWASVVVQCTLATIPPWDTCLASSTPSWRPTSPPASMGGPLTIRSTTPPSSLKQVLLHKDNFGTSLNE